MRRNGWGATRLARRRRPSAPNPIPSCVAAAVARLRLQGRVQTRPSGQGHAAASDKVSAHTASLGDLRPLALRSGCCFTPRLRTPRRLCLLLLQRTGAQGRLGLAYPLRAMCTHCSATS